MNVIVGVWRAKPKTDNTHTTNNNRTPEQLPFIWDAGEIVQTTHWLTVPPEYTNYQVLVGLYTFPTLERLSAMVDGQATADSRVPLVRRP